jgi:hypothetical protein
MNRTNDDAARLKTKAPKTIPGAIASGNDGQREDRMADPDDGFTGMEQ